MSRAWPYWAVICGGLLGFALGTTICCVPAADDGGAGGFVPPPTGSTNQNRNRNANLNTNANSSANTNTNRNTGDVGPPRPNSNSNTNANGNSNANVNSNANANANANQNSNSSTACNLNCNGVDIALLAPPDLGALPDETIFVGEVWRSDPVPVLNGDRPFVFSLTEAPSGVRFSGERLRWNSPIVGLSPCAVTLRACNCAGSDQLRVVLTVDEDPGLALSRVSIADNCSDPNEECQLASVSGNGSRIVFQTVASNMTPNDLNEVSDVYMVDLVARTLRRVSVDSDGASSASGEPSIRPQISDNGAYVAFQSFSRSFAKDDGNNLADVFVHEVASGETQLVSRSTTGAVGDSASESPVLSADGLLVAYRSFASNLVENDTNGVVDIFVRDQRLGQTERVSVNTAGEQAVSECKQPAISADGRFVAFVSGAENLVPPDTNGADDVFLFDRVARTLIKVSVAPGGSEANGASGTPWIGGANNEFIVFASDASNLVAGDANGDSDVFVHNRLTGQTELVSANFVGDASGNGQSLTPRITPDGRFIVFASAADDLVNDDFDAVFDVFVRDRVARTTRIVSRSDEGGQADGPSILPAISADGRFVVFDTKASNLTLNDVTPLGDVLMRDLTK